MIALIVAYDRNRLIGKKGKMPWNIPDELKRYKSLTTGNAILMGRSTFEGLDIKPLPDRLNLILTRYKKENSDNLKYVSSIDEAIEICKERDLDLFISGGESVYRLTLNLCEKLFITEIDAEFEGDTYFPEVDKSLYDIELECENNGEIPFKCYIYTKK